MATIHDARYREQLNTRIRALRSDSPRRWGKMSPDQMLWHVNAGLSMAVGESTAEFGKPPLPRPILKFLVLNLPWVKGAPTAPGFLAKSTYDFEAERARCLRLIERMAAAPLTGPDTDHPAFGRMSVQDVSRLQAKHVNHHLDQFGV